MHSARRRPCFRSLRCASKRFAEVAGEVLEPGEAAVLICFENAWAGPFAAAVRRNGGRLLDFQRVPTQEVIAAIQALDAGSAS